MNLKEYLKIYGLTASALAARSSVPVQCITRMVKGQRGVSSEIAGKISAGTFGEVTVAELLYPDGLPQGARIAPDEESMNG